MIEILLPVYNGAKYLSEQIDSILAQTHTDWVLKIRNDGSTDDSQRIIDDYCSRYPGKIVQIDRGGANIGLVKGLNLLLESAADADYVMPCDQDDVWMADKVEASLAALRSLEAKHPGKPAMVCTDARCVDSELRPLSESFFQAMRFRDDILGNASKMQALNVVQGCTMIFNRAAAEKVTPMPDNLRVHDAWMSLVINYYGACAYLHRPTLLYRQHSSNVLGEINPDFHYYLGRFRKAFSTMGELLQSGRTLPYSPNLAAVVWYKFKFAAERILKK